jgi:tripartite ATP-independent transporter DctM subunit
MFTLIILGVAFILLLILGIPIAFALGISSIIGLTVMGKPLVTFSISIFQGIESWVLLAVPSFIFAGVLMERCGISYRLIDFARSLVGWVRGGLGMTTVVGEILFSGISGSTIADVSAIASLMAPPMVKAGYKPEHTASIIAGATCLGILIPPAIFMIVIGTQTATSVVGIFLGAVLPGLVAGALMMLTIFFQASRFKWPVDKKPNLKWFLSATKKALIALFVPIVIIGGFRFGAFTATEAGAVCAFYAVLAASVFYRNVTLREMLNIGIETATLTAAVVFLLGTATIYQYIMASLGVPELFLSLFKTLSPLASFLVVSFITLLFGLVMEGLPAAVILLPVVFPVIVAKGINPIHFCVVLTLAASIGLFLPPTGAGLLLCLRLTNVKLSTQFIRSYMPYVVTIIIAFMIIIFFPSLTLILPHSAGIK